jgi:hypothetical protein
LLQALLPAHNSGSEIKPDIEYSAQDKEDKKKLKR